MLWLAATVMWTLTIFVNDQSRDVRGYTSKAQCEADATDLARYCLKPKTSTFNTCWTYDHVCLPEVGR